MVVSNVVMTDCSHKDDLLVRRAEDELEPAEIMSVYHVPG